MNMLGQHPKKQRHNSLGNDSLMSPSPSRRPNEEVTEETENAEFAESIVRPIFSWTGCCDLPAFMGGLGHVDWGTWRKAYEAMEEHYLENGSRPEIEFDRPWFLLFITCAANLSLHYKGGIEVQMLIHEAIYRDLRGTYGGTGIKYVKGLSALMDLVTFKEGLYLGIYGARDAQMRRADFMAVCLEAVSRITSRSTPIVHDTFLYYSGCRIGLDPMPM